MYENEQNDTLLKKYPQY